MLKENYHPLFVQSYEAKLLTGIVHYFWEELLTELFFFRLALQATAIHFLDLGPCK